LVNFPCWSFSPCRTKVTTPTTLLSRACSNPPVISFFEIAIMQTPNIKVIINMGLKIFVDSVIKNPVMDAWKFRIIDAVTIVIPKTLNFFMLNKIKSDT